MADVKWGAGHAAAMFRAGHKELGQALVALPQGTIRPVEEPGLVGNLTPQEVVDSKQSYEARLDQAAARENGDRTARGLER
ncbi:MAG: hypothetical protein Q8K78_00745 [Planctomycetaceae bacterium]|nr:hypothetical protein [Planctomycetaceae bacterium]